MKRAKRAFPILSDNDLAELNDSFPYGEFSGTFWSAKRVDSPTEIRKLLDSFRLVGRKIRHVWTESHDYQHSKEGLENAVYNDLHDRLGLSEADAQADSDLDSFDPRARIARCMEIDTPLVLEFDSRETFEIDVTDAPTYRMSMNRIPRRLLENNFDNVNPQVMFSPVLGKTIAAVDLRTVPEGYDDESVEAVLFRLDDGNTLEIQGWFDFIELALLAGDGKTITESVDVLRPGFFNYEDLHRDRRTGFEAKDATLWFGRKGRSKLGPFAMELSILAPRGKRPNRAFIDGRDALGLALGICAKRPAAFATREATDWSVSEWHSVLDAGRQFLSGPRLADVATPAARLFFETPPTSCSTFWGDTDEDRMRRQRDRLLLCLDEIRRWMETACPPDSHIRLQW